MFLRSFFHKLVPSRLVRFFRRSRAFLARLVNGFPERKLMIVGVTGTDGKTTTVNLVGHIVKTTGKKVGWISTLGAQVGDKFLETGAHTTTVHPFTFYKLLAQMAREKCELVIVELTSHALEQDRVGSLPLHAAIITNISHEHLDYHGSLDKYLQAKMKIFSLVRLGKRRRRGYGTVVLNKEDLSYKEVSHRASLMGLKEFTFGIGNGMVRGEHLEETLDAMTFTLITESEHYTVRTRLVGEYNLRNILGATAISHVIGVPWGKVHEGIETFQPLPGRLEPIAQGQPFQVFVDFAHTPQALREVLSFFRHNAKGKVIVVFGATGERDKEKRPVMGEVVGRNADFAFITEEDPRSESVEEISHEVAKGLESIKKIVEKDYWLISDRREAIRAAFKKAVSGDVVLLAGKGHEQMMAVKGGEDRPWDDRKVAREELERLGWRR